MFYMTLGNSPSMIETVEVGNFLNNEETEIWKFDLAVFCWDDDGAVVVDFQESSYLKNCFKELGLCYGKLEAGLLTFIIPIVLLGHLVYCSFALAHVLFNLITSLISCFIEALMKFAFEIQSGLMDDGVCETFSAGFMDGLVCIICWKEVHTTH
ncbi:hypothetical protein ACLB2K_031540 [Fragaria x ananassa]